MSERLKILPLLILVATLAFSVRLVEVVSGVRDMSGGAFAAAEETAVDAVMPSQEKLAMADAPEDEPDQEQQEEPAGDEAAAPVNEEALDTSKWRDASDSDIDISSVKMEMFKDMAARRKALDKREQELVTREALLQAAEKEIDRKYQEMDALRIQIEQFLEDNYKEEKERIASLVKI